MNMAYCVVFLMTL